MASWTLKRIAYKTKHSTQRRLFLFLNRMHSLLSDRQASVKHLRILQMSNTSESRTKIVSDETQPAVLSPCLREQRAPGQRSPCALLRAPPLPAGTPAEERAARTQPMLLSTLHLARPGALCRSFPSPSLYKHITSSISSPFIFEVRSVNWRVSSAAAMILQGC